MSFSGVIRTGKNWQPNIDFLKQNVNVQNEDINSDIFVEEVIKPRRNHFLA